MTKPSSKTFSVGSATTWWLTIKRGLPTTCTNKACKSPIHTGDRFLYQHGIAGVVQRQFRCLACSAGIEFRVSDRIHATPGELPVTQQRIVNLLSCRDGDATKVYVARILSIGVETTSGHLKGLERRGLVERTRHGHQAAGWRLTPEGATLADPTNAGFPPLPDQT
jgi:DNA-binding MarR family transcriptional regulator